ncbi:MAG TPA: hypothetical protein VF174_12745 [Micromonosporaceae bacterium]
MQATHPTDRASRVEGVVLVLILLTVAGFAGAASFTHVKDWTLANSPEGTGEWFGWANAVISELVPIAALLTIRRRRRTGGPIGYPMFLLIAAAALSLSAQLAVAKPSPSGWLLSAVPALAFMALAKLVLAPVKPGHQPTTTEPADAAADAPTPVNAQPTPTVVEPEPTPTVVEQVPVVDKQPEPVTEPVAEPVTVPAHLIPAARFAVVNHQQHTGRPITAEQLADRLDITPTIASHLLAIIDPPATTTPARVNGAPVLNGATA